MTERDQKIAIAKSVGWTFQSCEHGTVMGWIPPKGWHRTQPSCCTEEELPDYVHDVSAIMEAVTTLLYNNLEQWEAYIQTLYKICHFENPLITDGANKRLEVIAPRCAEAYLRTIGLWTDEDSDRLISSA